MRQKQRFLCCFLLAQNVDIQRSQAWDRVLWLFTDSLGRKFHPNEFKSIREWCWIVADRFCIFWSVFEWFGMFWIVWLGRGRFFRLKLFVHPFGQVVVIGVGFAKPFAAVVQIIVVLIVWRVGFAKL